ncbi:ATP-binding protein [Vibrio metschnikovii]|uniref:AAA family ATPase n=1 Tax=Vibrio metschnikovii TaxID=28172 RepID=UPI000E06EFD6|nr:AAA family ATPase [Vibrio metschnikovii]SUP49824.1 ATP-binding protein [Vibrio metschnikovii]SUQ10237.1 ATP-binding protein [Vibrio metschnikovii]
MSVITSQFKRIIEGGVPLTKYDFYYETEADDTSSGIILEFNIDPESKPISNIHALIGRNGVGKTTILNNMVNAIISNGNSERSKVGHFYQPSIFGPIDLEDDYFRGVISVSFSAFDPFTPPPKETLKNIDFNYIGLKTINQSSYNGEDRLKTKDELCQELLDSLKVCLSVSGKRERWLNAVHKLESDVNFSNMDLDSLIEIEAGDLTEDRRNLGLAAIEKFTSLSSGHAIVLLILTRLVECLEEKTLVLIDEPESHLHPPLLSAFTRALSDMLLNRNGVAIIATHSPVVLQEIPKSCVSILRRNRTVSTVTRPKSETFGENVGILTREIFGLEVSKSGFYDLLAKSVKEGKSYDQILRDYRNQIGYEGQAILRALIANIED